MYVYVGDLCSCSLWLERSIDILAMSSFLFQEQGGVTSLGRVIDVHLGYCKSGNHLYYLI